MGFTSIGGKSETGGGFWKKDVSVMSAGVGYINVVILSYV